MVSLEGYYKSLGRDKIIHLVVTDSRIPHQSAWLDSQPYLLSSAHADPARQHSGGSTRGPSTSQALALQMGDLDYFLGSWLLAPAPAVFQLL